MFSILVKEKNKCSLFHINCTDNKFQYNLIEIGWGTTEFGGVKSNTLQKVTLSVITYRECHRYYPDLLYSQLCTYGKEKDACQVIANSVHYKQKTKIMQR